VRRLIVTLVVLSTVSWSCTSSDDAPAPTVSPAGSPAVATPTPSPTADPAAGVRAFVTDFMEARIGRDADRARSFLAPFAAEQYDDGEDGLTLIGTSNPHFESWEFVSIQAADANSYEVQVTVAEAYTESDETSSFEEVLFVGPGTDVDGQQRPFVIRGAGRTSSD